MPSIKASCLSLLAKLRLLPRHGHHQRRAQRWFASSGQRPMCSDPAVDMAGCAFPVMLGVTPALSMPWGGHGRDREQRLDGGGLEFNADSEHLAGFGGGPSAPGEMIRPRRREYHSPGGRVDACLSPPLRRDVSRPALRFAAWPRSRSRYGAPGSSPHAGEAAMPRASRRAPPPLRKASTRDLSPCLEPDDVLAATARNQIGDMRPPALERVAFFIGKVVALIDADDAGERAATNGSEPSRSPAG